VWALAWAPNAAWLAASTGHGTIVIRPYGGPAGAPAGELVPLADGGWAALGDGWHKISGRVSGEFWYAINMCRFEPGVLGADREGSQPLALDAPLPGRSVLDQFAGRTDGTRRFPGETAAELAELRDQRDAPDDSRQM
jgi:hypothetical protein